MALSNEGHKGQKHDRMNYNVVLHFEFRIFFGLFRFYSLKIEGFVAIFSLISVVI